MKRLNIKVLLLCAVSVACAFAADADTIATRRWDKRVNWRYEGWERLKPKNAKVQYAGGMGFLSLGAGWEYGNRNQWNSDFFVGFLPKQFSDELHFTFTIKQTYTPWSMRFCDWLSYEPLTCGLYFTTISGEDFWQREPCKYPNRYYNFSSKLRTSIFLGQSITFYQKRFSWMRNISFFYEIGTNELYIISKATNKTVRMGDILRLSFGLKMQIFKPHE